MREIEKTGLLRALFLKPISRQEEAREKDDMKRVITLVSEGEMKSYIIGDEMDMQRQELSVNLPGKLRYRSKKYSEERTKRVTSFLEQFK